MFINKYKEKSVTDLSKMSSYINLFLKTEVTCIPKLLKRYIGDYYNNALFNGATWIFVLWCVLHIVFDTLIDAFLKKLRYREYVRMRLKNSLWYLGFYGTAVIYSHATLTQNEVELFNFKRMHVPSSSNLPSQVVIGYTLLSTFFLHSSLWEGLAKEYFLNMFSYLFLFIFLVSSYILRVVEISFTFTALVGIAQLAIEFTRCCFMTSSQEGLISRVFLGLLYFTTYSICFAVYIVVIPLTFVVPLGLKIMSDYPNILLLFLFFNLVSWLIVEIYQSILFKFFDHWFYHQDEKECDNFLQCSIGLLECSLFKPRDDISYNLQIIKKEIKARETKMMSMRKPKNKTMLIQTLKCMVAIKKKLSERRRSDSSDSESEKSDNLNTDEENGELLSDQDEESDDEQSNVDIKKSVGESKELDENEESDENGDSFNEDSDKETEKEHSTEETDSDSKLTDDTINLESNTVEVDNNNKEETVKSNIKVNQSDTDLKTKDTNKDDLVIAHQGDNTAVQTINENIESKDRDNSCLSVEGDAKEINKTEDSDNNNSVLSKDDNVLQNKESTKLDNEGRNNSNLNIDKKDKETEPTENN